MGTKSGGRGGGGEGEIIQVQGGHIVRSTGRKDRHSKVYTAKGPRDRRVRLSAHTAIQFYDVQDRLGYDRPSKAVDWLIKKAQSSIDKLAQLPPWHPPAHTNEGLELEMEQENEEEQSAAVTAESDYSSSFHLHNNSGGGGNHPTASFLHPDGISDTMKSFFPTSSSTNLSMNFQSYPPDLISRSSANQSQDLGLSLHSFVDHPQSGHDGGNHHQGIFQSGSGGPVGYETNFQDWSNETSTENRGGAFGFSNHNPNQLAAAAAQHAMMGQDGSSAAFAASSSSSSQRGPLQSNGFFGRAWNDVVPMGTENHHNHQHHNQQHERAYEFHQSVLFGSRFLGSSEGIHNQGFRIPARIHGGEQEGGCDRAGSSSSPGGRSAEH